MCADALSNALRLSQDMLESLPVSVIGFDNDGLIVFANRCARDLFEREGRFLLSSMAEDVLDVKTVDLVNYAMETTLAQEEQYLFGEGHNLIAKCVPLYEDSRVRGVVLTLTELKED